MEQEKEDAAYEKGAEKLMIDDAERYMDVMVSMKQVAVRENSGPQDLPSVLSFRYEVNASENTDASGWGDDFVEGGEMGRFVVGTCDGFKIVQDVSDLSFFAGENQPPGESMLSMMSKFLEVRRIYPSHVALLGDGVGPKEKFWDGVPEEGSFQRFLDERHGDERSLHEIFMNDPFAGEFLTEVLTVFVMDHTGRMVRSVCPYTYDRRGKSRVAPIFSDRNVEYLGKVFNKDREFITSQRVIAHMVLFYAMCQKEEDEKRNDG